MKTELLDLLQKKTNQNSLDTSLSLRPFVDFLEQKMKQTGTRLSPFFNLVYDHIHNLPDWEKPISLAEIDAYQSVFEMIYYTFSPPIAVGSEEIWGLTQPLSSVLFFGTTPLYNLFRKRDGSLNEMFFDQGARSDFISQKTRITYAFILRKLYEISYNPYNDVVYSYQDEKSGLNKYFEIDIDTQFIEVNYKRGNLPQLDFSMFHGNHFDEEKNIETLARVLPLENFSFKGFSIIRVTNITEKHVLNQIKDNILDLEPNWALSEKIPAYLKTLLGKNGLEIKLLPIQKLNGHLTLNDFDSLAYFLNVERIPENFDEKQYREAFKEYVNDPGILFYPDMTKIQKNEPQLISFLRQSYFQSFASIPMFFGERLVGLLMLFSEVKNVLSERSLAALNPVAPLLERLFKSINEEFYSTIDNLIKDNFTALQPAVQWRFNQAAWDYIKRKEVDDKAEIEAIYFEEVYPLYGDIDVKDSMLKRNTALQKDTRQQLQSLLDILNKADSSMEIQRLQQVIDITEEWDEIIGKSINSEEEYHLQAFLKNKVEPILKQLQQSGQKDVRRQVETYFKASKSDGKFHLNRRNLEKALQQLNKTIRISLDKMNTEIQAIYPSYFEKFRTDGVEYDICIGQSIAPQKEFSPAILKRIKCLQLKNMVEITRLTHQLELELSQHLQTTQLIFIHAYTIDISFRSDELRFDVEGDSNIRYEMTKKRIEKVHIKNTEERLTQPGKIAIVYFKKEDIEDILTFIPEMQKEGSIDNNIEYVNLEDIKSLGDLKAVRLTVRR